MWFSDQLVAAVADGVSVLDAPMSGTSDQIRAGTLALLDAIAPGLMATENALDGLPQELVDDFVNNRQLVHRLGTMDDIVSTALYLLSDEASFITGETLKVSGGYPLAI